MSGGSWDYLCYKIADAAKQLQLNTQTPERRAFGKHLELVAEAMHDIEWVDSSDKGPGDENAAIKAVLGEHADQLIVAECLVQAKELVLMLRKLGVEV